MRQRHVGCQGGSEEDEAQAEDQILTTHVVPIGTLGYEVSRRSGGGDECSSPAAPVKNEPRLNAMPGPLVSTLTAAASPWTHCVD